MNVPSEPLCTIRVPGLVMKNLTNQREHWSSGAERARAQRTQTAMMARLRLQAGARAEVMGAMASDGLHVLVIRHAARMLDVGDNLPASAKHVRDGVSDALGIDDRDPRVSWAYDQQAGEPAVTIEMYARSVCPCCGQFAIAQRSRT